MQINVSLLIKRNQIQQKVYIYICSLGDSLFCLLQAKIIE